MKILLTPAEYADKLREAFAGDVPETAVFDAARQFPQSPASFWLAVQAQLTSVRLLEDLQEVRREISRLNEAAGQTIFNPAATMALAQQIAKIEERI